MIMFFFSIFSDRYAEQVNPLLIQSQHKLRKRVVAHGAALSPQLHLPDVLPTNAKQYTAMRLKIYLPEDYPRPEIGPGAGIDPAGSDIYNG